MHNSVLYYCEHIIKCILFTRRWLTENVSRRNGNDASDRKQDPFPEEAE